MNRLLWWSDSEAATLRFGTALGGCLANPVWLGLTGPLGAGKTRLVQGVAAGLGFAGRVRSPSYVLEHRYRGRVPIRHLDLYRLEGSDPELEASWEEEVGGAVLVEWAERAGAAPVRSLWVRLEPAGPTGRWILLEWEPTSGVLRDFPLERLRMAA